MVNKDLKLIYSILKELCDGNKPNEIDYGIDIDKYGQLLEMMQDYNLIKDADIEKNKGKNKIFKVKLDDCQITFKGVNYLYDNSRFALHYNGLKSIREWL